MLLRLLTLALHPWTASSVSLPPNAQLIQNISSTTAKTGGCFSSPLLHRPSYTDCLSAASALLATIPSPNRPTTFARKGNAGFKLPITVRKGTCVISLEVANDDGIDQVQPWAVYAAALELVGRCVGGGRRSVGLGGVVEVSVFGREVGAGDGGGGLVGEMSNTTVVDGGRIDGNASSAWNTTELELATPSLVNGASVNAGAMCFEMPKASEIRGAADQRDCYQAADDMIEGKPRGMPLTFSRNSNAAFHLPATFNHGTCCILVDVLNADDEDTFELWTLYGVVLDVANRCTMSPDQATNIWGGKRAAGLRDLVSVCVAGMAVAETVSVPTTSGDAHIVTRTQAVSEVPEISGDSFIKPDVPILEALASGGKPGLNTSTNISNGSSASIITRLGGELTCYDPPLPRELLYPYVMSDCEEASDQIIGNRNKWAAYIFSRKPSTDPHWYQLPVRYTHGSCVIFIDMKNDKDEDSVRVTYVASSAWVLAHKCSGEENPEYRYGGFMTVSVGAADLISINVYGRPSGQSPTLALSQNASSIGRE